jgi:hypothetical protein
MPDEKLSTVILTKEVVVGHRGDGHIFRFPMLADGTITLHGLLIEPNPKAKRDARRYLTEAYIAAKEALLETSMAQKKGETIVETAIEARGAERGPTVRNVLVWSLGLVIVAMAVVWFVFFRTHWTPV